MYAKISFEAGNDCIAQYLLGKNLLEDELKDFEPSKESNCDWYEERAKFVQHQIFNELFVGLEESFGPKKIRLPKGVSRDDVCNSIDKPTFIDIMLKGMILKRTAYSKLYDVTVKQMYDRVFVALLTFTTKEEFSGIFDMIDPTTEQEEHFSNTKIQGYCMRKYLSVNNIITIKILNPYNITIPSDENCSEFVKKSLKEITTEIIGIFKGHFTTEKLSKHHESCIEKSFNDFEANNFFMGLTVSITFLSHDEIEAERIKFFDLMENVKNGTLNCMK